MHRSRRVRDRRYMLALLNPAPKPCRASSGDPTIARARLRPNSTLMAPLIHRTLMLCAIAVALPRSAQADSPGYRPRPACGPIPGTLERDRFASLPGPYTERDRCGSSTLTWPPRDQNTKVVDLGKFDPVPPAVPASSASASTTSPRPEQIE